MSQRSPASQVWSAYSLGCIQQADVSSSGVFVKEHILDGVLLNLPPPELYIRLGLVLKVDVKLAQPGVFLLKFVAAGATCIQVFKQV